MKSLSNSKPTLSNKLSDWQMPFLNVEACSDSAKFVLAVAEQSLGNLSKHLAKHWKEPSCQEQCLRDMVRLLYCTDWIGHHAESATDFPQFFRHPPTVLRSVLTETKSTAIRSLMARMGDDGRRLVYSAFLTRPEYLLKDDDDAISRHQVLQDQVNKWHKCLRKTFQELRDQLDSLERKSIG
jgi:hypothetical protein